MSLDIDGLFTYHRPDEMTGKIHGKIRYMIGWVTKNVYEHLQGSAERTLFVRKMQEAVMWASATLALHGLNDFSFETQIHEEKGYRQGVAYHQGLHEKDLTNEKLREVERRNALYWLSSVPDVIMPKEVYVAILALAARDFERDLESQDSHDEIIEEERREYMKLGEMIPLGTRLGELLYPRDEATNEEEDIDE